MRILHLSADYPDPLVPAKTRAVANLLALVPGHDHHVYTLNRVDWRPGWMGGAGIAALAFADAAGADHRALAYPAPPKGLMLARFLAPVADAVLADLAARGLRPDLVHAHKISVEGLVAGRIARALGIPFVLSLQGDSDLKIVGVKRSLRARYAALWHEAAAVFPFAPWTATRMAGLLGPRTGPVHPLPCPSLADAELAPRLRGPAAPVIASAFHLGVAGRKNAAGLIRAVGIAAREIPELGLEILGGGDAAAFARLTRLAATAAPGRVRFLGAVPHAEVQRRLNDATAFALVSQRESFGMVFAEALRAGTPCLIPAGWGIDGYLPEGGVLLRAAPDDTGAIAHALVRLVREEAAFKNRLATLQAAGGLRLFSGAAVGETYRAALDAIASARRPDGPI